jgi:hypothetical protein
MKYPLTFLQESRLICEEHTWNMGRHMAPFFVAATHLLEGTLNIVALEQSLNLVIDRHAGLRAAFMPTGGLSSFALLTPHYLLLPDRNQQFISRRC